MFRQKNIEDFSKKKIYGSIFTPEINHISVAKLLSSNWIQRCSAGHNQITFFCFKITVQNENCCKSRCVKNVGVNKKPITFGAKNHYEFQNEKSINATRRHIAKYFRRFCDYNYVLPIRRGSFVQLGRLRPKLVQFWLHASFNLCTFIKLKNIIILKLQNKITKILNKDWNYLN